MTDVYIPIVYIYIIFPFYYKTKNTKKNLTSQWIIPDKINLKSLKKKFVICFMIKWHWSQSLRHLEVKFDFQVRILVEEKFFFRLDFYNKHSTFKDYKLWPKMNDKCCNTTIFVHFLCQFVIFLKNSEIKEINSEYFLILF